MTPSPAEREARERVEEEFGIVHKMGAGGKQFCLKSAMMNVDALLATALDRRDAEIDRIKDVADNKDLMLTVHILRNWKREKIERFCLHLLGDKWQSIESLLLASKDEIERLKGALKMIAGCYQHQFQSCPCQITAIKLISPKPEVKK